MRNNLYIDIERALTIREPWVWAFLHAGKRIENRSWRTNYRGPIFLHTASAAPSPASRALARSILDRMGIDYPCSERITPLGALVARAELIDCTRNVPRGQARWADPHAWHWLFDNLVILPEPIKVPGKLGLWRVNAQLLLSSTSRADSGA